MTQELIWGKSGSPHIDGNDIGTINLAMRGIGNYVLDYKDKLKATVASANKITIGTGVMSFEGRDIIISAAETVTIESGSQGMKRNDIICEHYHRDTSSGVETTNLVAVKGTPASSNPKDPTIPSGTILGGATDAYMPLYRIPLDGITVGTPVQLFDVLTPLKTVGDSVTQMIEAGTLSVKPSAVGASYIKFAHPHDAPPLAVTATIAKWPGDEERGRYVIPTVWDTTKEGFQLRFYRRDLGDWVGRFDCAVSWIAVWAA